MESPVSRYRAALRPRLPLRSARNDRVEQETFIEDLKAQGAQLPC
jgi:hypothetical protein